jgi:stage II sporulation protein P
VVGSSWGGEECPNWQKNLSLAMKLREKLNASYTNICRPPELSALTYNQELSEYSLMLVVGSFGNSLKEAKNAVKYISDSLAELINSI